MRRRRDKERPDRRRWWRLVALSLLVLGMTTGATLVLGRILLNAIDPLDAVEAVGALSGNDYEDTSILVFEGSREDAEAALRDDRRENGAGAGRTAEASNRRASKPAAGGTSSTRPSADADGKGVRVYFEPTPQLMDFLEAIDQLDHDGTLQSIEKFLAENGETLRTEELAVPVQYFYDLLASGKTLPEAVMETLQTHGLAGKQAVERVVDLKRDEYEAKLDKYMKLSLEHGVHKEYKIHRYQQKIDMVDRVQGELNKSFRIE